MARSTLIGFSLLEPSGFHFRSIFTWQDFYVRARVCVCVCVAGLKRVGGIQFIFIYCEQMVGLMELPAENRKQQKAEFFWKYFL